jgi:uncharacterized protein involved in outer membrane biogenesis
MKILKKFLKITGITFLILLALLIALPIIFKDKIIEMAKKEINNSLNAKVDFGEIDLGIFHSFPNLTLSLNNLIVIGVDDFEKDTLVKFNNLSTELDVFSVFGDQIKIKGIELTNPDIHVKVLKGGKANWDIMKASTDTTSVTDTTSSSFKLALNKFEIINGKIVYDDNELGVFTSFENFSFLLKGDLTDAFSTLETKASLDSLVFAYEGMKFINKAKVELNSNIDADLANSKYTFKDNTAKLNEIELAFNGSVAMPTDDILLDLSFEAKKTDFKNLLSLIPAVYMSDFANIKTSGKMGFSGNVKGTYNDKLMPGFGVKLIVENGSFKYPTLPASVENINIDMAVDNKDGQPDNTNINIKKFHVDLAGSPFDMRLMVSTPVSDANMDGMIKGVVDLTKVKSFMPIEDASLSGVIKADVEFAGRMSMIEQEKYEDFKAKGTIDLTGINYVSGSLSAPVNIETASMEVTPKYFDLKNFNAKMGSSDFAMDGKIENFLAYVFKDELIKGVFNFNSQNLNINQLMGGETTTAATTEPVAADTSSLTAFEVPENVDFVLNSSIGNMLYDKLEIKNTKGSIIIRDGKVDLNGLNMQLLDGSMSLSGYYSTKGTPNPDVDMKIDIKEFDVKKTFESFETIKKIAPIAEKCSGKISLGLSFSGKLTHEMAPEMKTINGAGSLNTKSLTLSNVEALDKLSKLIKSDKYKNLTLQNANLKFKIVDGNIEIEPFVTKVGKTDMEFGGKQGLDQIADYSMNFKIPTSELGSTANELLGNLSSQAGGLGLNIKMPEFIDVKGLITGPVTKPEIKFNLKNQAKDAVENVKDQVVDKINEEVDKVKAEAIRKAQEQADKLMKEADVQTQKLMEAAQTGAKQINDAAKVAADKVRSEGNAAADKLLSEAKSKGPIAEKLAKEPAKKLREEAEKKGQAIQDKAKSESDLKLQQAQQESDKVKTKAKAEGDKLIEEAKKK